MHSDWKKDLLEEKSLYAAYRRSSGFSKSGFNEFVILAVGISSLAIVTYWFVTNTESNALAALLAIARLGFDLVVQLLGFLIGGFAIFIVFSNTDVMSRLAKAKIEEYNISVFKYIFYNFLSVFSIYLTALAVFYFILSISAIKFSPAIAIFGSRGLEFFHIVNSFAFVVCILLSALCIVRLKSFIWNVYQAFITFLLVTDRMAKEDK